MTAINLKNVSLQYPVYGASTRSLKKDILRLATGGKLAETSKGIVIVEALKDISFSLQSGDRLGLVGSNGAGKTTLLKVLANIYTPTTGDIHVEGNTNCLF